MDHQVVGMWIGILGAILGIFGVWYRIDRDTNAKIDSISKTFSKNLADAMEQGDEKRARIYTRLDEVKNEHKKDFEGFRKEIMETFVPSKICTLMHTTSEKTMEELKKAVQNLEVKVDKVITKLYEKNGGQH